MVLRLDLLEQPRHRLHIVVEDLRAGFHDDLQGFERAFEIGDEHFHGAARQQLADAADDHGKNRRAAVLAVVPVDGGDDSMLQIHRLDRLGYPFGLQPVQQPGAAVLDVAEAAGAGAHIPQHEEGGGAGAPAFAHVGAHGLLADGVQSLRAHERLQVLVGFAGGCAHLDPVGAAEGGGVGLGRVEPVAGGGDGHGFLISDFR